MQHEGKIHEVGGGAKLDKAKLYMDSPLELKNLMMDPTYLKGTENKTTGVKEKGLQDLDEQVDKAANKIRSLDESSMDYKRLLGKYNDAVDARDAYELIPGGLLKKEIPTDPIDRKVMEDEAEELMDYVNRRLANRKYELQRPGATTSDKTRSFELMRQELEQKLKDIRKGLPTSLAA